MENTETSITNINQNTTNINEKNDNNTNVNYNELSKKQLVNELQNILKAKTDIIKQKTSVEIIKAVFYKKQHDDIAKLSEEFAKDEKNKDKEFNYELDEYDKKIKELLNKYKTLRSEQIKKLEELKEINYKQKLIIIDEINKLINSPEVLNVTFEKFHELQNRWKEIKLIPQNKINQLQSAYHLTIEKFYDYIKINNELRNYDLKKNLEAKQKIIEKTKKIIDSKDIIKAFKTLQTYHEQWKEIGPVPKDLREKIWDEFKDLTIIINKKHTQYFIDLKKQLQENLEQKTLICEKIEKINTIENPTQKEWTKNTNEIKLLQEKWKTIGIVPKKDNDSIYERFKTATNIFFEKRKEFLKNIKEQQKQNLNKKIELCEQVEELSKNTDWKETTKKIINIQKKWKNIGPVPHKDSDKIWKRFRAACDTFFANKEENFKQEIIKQEQNLIKKQEIIKQAENFKKTENTKDDIDKLKELQKKWNETGPVPIKEKLEINKKFYSILNKAFNDINLDNEKAELIKFELKIESILNNSKTKLDDEKIKLQNQISKTKNDILQLENNIGFFANTDKKNKFIIDVKNKIEKTKQTLNLLNKKLKILKTSENKFNKKNS